MRLIPEDLWKALLAYLSQRPAGEALMLVNALMACEVAPDPPVEE